MVPTGESSERFLDVLEAHTAAGRDVMELSNRKLFEGLLQAVWSHEEALRAQSQTLETHDKKFEKLGEDIAVQKRKLEHQKDQLDKQWKRVEWGEKKYTALIAQQKQQHKELAETIQAGFAGFRQRHEADERKRERDERFNRRGGWTEERKRKSKKSRSRSRSHRSRSETSSTGGHQRKCEPKQPRDDIEKREQRGRREHEKNKKEREGKKERENELQQGAVTLSQYPEEPESDKGEVIGPLRLRSSKDDYKDEEDEEVSNDKDSNSTQAKERHQDNISKSAQVTHATIPVASRPILLLPSIKSESSSSANRGEVKAEVEVEVEGPERASEKKPVSVEYVEYQEAGQNIMNQVKRDIAELREKMKKVDMLTDDELTKEVDEFDWDKEMAVMDDNARERSKREMCVIDPDKNDKNANVDLEKCNEIPQDVLLHDPAKNAKIADADADVNPDERTSNKVPDDFVEGPG